MTDGIFWGLVGGSIIGLAASIMLLFNGRILGVSGIVGGFITAQKADLVWRVVFFVGMLAGAGVSYLYRPEFFINESNRSLATVAIAGLLVGFGTSMGTGCTSGHGVCGISRLSPRSMVATVVFMIFGFLTASLLHLIMDGAS